MNDKEKRVTATFICKEISDEISILQRLEPHIDSGEIIIVSIDNHFVTAKIDAEFATFLKLSNDDIGTRMHISGITDELKDKYRSRPGSTNL